MGIFVNFIPESSIQFQIKVDFHNNTPINDNLEEQAQSLFNRLFESHLTWSSKKLGEISRIKGGKRLPLDEELVDYPTSHPYIRVRDLTSAPILRLNSDFMYITEETYHQISSYIVSTNDIIVSIVGTIGLISIIDESLNKANLTENCVRITEIKEGGSEFLFYYLNYLKANRELDLLTVGAVQAKLPLYNIQNINVFLPPADVLSVFQRQIQQFRKVQNANLKEISELEKAKALILSNLSH